MSNSEKERKHTVRVSEPQASRIRDKTTKNVRREREGEGGEREGEERKSEEKKKDEHKTRANNDDRLE